MATPNFGFQTISNSNKIDIVNAVNTPVTQIDATLNNALIENTNLKSDYYNPTVTSSLAYTVTDMWSNNNEYTQGLELSDGYIYIGAASTISSTTNGSIYKYAINSDGSTSFVSRLQLSSTSNTHPNSLCIFDGILFACNADNGTVSIINISSFTEAGSFAPKNQITDICFFQSTNNTDVVYVIGNSIGCNETYIEQFRHSGTTFTSMNYNIYSVSNCSIQYQQDATMYGQCKLNLMSYKNSAAGNVNCSYIYAYNPFENAPGSIITLPYTGEAEGICMNGTNIYYSVGANIYKIDSSIDYIRPQFSYANGFIVRGGVGTVAVSSGSTITISNNMSFPYTITIGERALNRYNNESPAFLNFNYIPAGHNTIAKSYPLDTRTFTDYNKSIVLAVITGAGFCAFCVNFNIEIVSNLIYTIHVISMGLVVNGTFYSSPSSFPSDWLGQLRISYVSL